MKRFALLILGLVALASPAMADINPLVGDISIFQDDQGNSCDLAFAGFAQWYIIHKFDPGEEATGARFKLTVPAGMSVIAFNTQFVTIGNLSSDLSIAYGGCATATTVLGQAIVSGTVPAACSYASIVAGDILPTPIATDCLFGEYEMKTGQGIINGSGCPCNVAAQPSTWGKVKSLYR